MLMMLHSRRQIGPGSMASPVCAVSAHQAQRTSRRCAVKHHQALLADCSTLLLAAVHVFLSVSCLSSCMKLCVLCYAVLTAGILLDDPTVSTAHLMLGELACVVLTCVQ